MNNLSVKIKPKDLTLEAIKCQDAHYLMGHDWYKLPKWFQEAYEGKGDHGIRTIIGVNYPSKYLCLVTEKDENLNAHLDDWIVLGVTGLVFVVKGAQFSKMYEMI